jgi:Protein of unknown function (DUF4012)
VTVRHARRRRRPRRIIVTLSVAGGLVILLAVAGGWLGTRVLSAKSSLESAQSLVGTVKKQAMAMDFAGIGASSTKLSKLTADAVKQVHDPVWRAAEYMPFAGKNLTVVRELAESIDSIAHDTIAPLATAASTLSIESLKPVDGRINVEPIQELAAAMAPAAAALDATTKRVAAIDASSTIGPVSDAYAKLDTMLQPVNEMIGRANSALAIAPDMLGVSGPRTYLLVFQNLAEATALGGTSAALTEVKVDNGAISVERQASSGDFPWRDHPIMEPDPTLSALYTPEFYTRLNLSTSRPDFPTAAGIAQAFWHQYIGGTVDGVISIDPAALGYILKATGPVKMSTGDQLTSDNVVKLLLNEVYFRYAGKDVGAKTDDFFQEAATTMFNALMTTKAEPKAIMQAISKGVTNHRILAWSAHPTEQELLGTSPLSGILPTDNTSSTTTGVFFRDMSASKMDYYLKTAATLTTDSCTSSTPTFTTKVELHSNITPEQADNLPAYVASAPWGGKQFQTQAFFYGPPGTKLASTSVDAAGVLSEVGGTGDDLGRPVVWFWVVLAPGQSSTITATFTGAEGTYAAPELRTTPMLNPTTVTVDSPGCVAKK